MILAQISSLDGETRHQLAQKAWLQSELRLLLFAVLFLEQPASGKGKFLGRL